MAIKIIGVTGPSGAGKSYLSLVLGKRGLPFIDADAVYHSLLTKGSDCTKALIEEFGNEILDENQAPDTKKLGAIVFSSEEKLERLNQIVLGFVISKINDLIKELEQKGNTTVILDAPTLIESGFSKECDVVISVLCDKETRIKRIIERDKISYEKALIRVSAQKNDEFYIRNSHFVLLNDNNVETFGARIDELFDNILNN